MRRREVGRIRQIYDRWTEKTGGETWTGVLK